MYSKPGKMHKKNVTKGIGVLAGFSIIGFLGHNAITPDEPTIIFPGDGTYLEDTITGKKDLKEQHAKEKAEIEKQLISIRKERDILIQEKVSRGNIDREDAYQKQKVIQAISNNLGGVFKNKAEYIYTKSKAYNVNPMLVAAICKFETADGTSELVKKANNPGGLNWYKGCKNEKFGWYQKFETLEDGIEELIRVLKEVYIDNGHGDINSIGNKYAPLNDTRNGIGGMDNSKWSKVVTQFYIQIKNESEVK